MALRHERAAERAKVWSGVFAAVFFGAIAGGVDLYKAGFASASVAFVGLGIFILFKASS